MTSNDGHFTGEPDARSSDRTPLNNPPAAPANQHGRGPVPGWASSPAIAQASRRKRPVWRIIAGSLLIAFGLLTVLGSASTASARRGFRFLDSSGGELTFAYLLGWMFALR